MNNTENNGHHLSLNLGKFFTLKIHSNIHDHPTQPPLEQCHVSPIPETLSPQNLPPLSQTMNTMSNPKCCINTDGKCLCYSLKSCIICSGSNEYKNSKTCSYACNDWSVPFQATGFGFRLNWFCLGCLTNTCCSENGEMTKCCECPLCCPSLLCCNKRYISSGHICNLNICSMINQCCVCHGNYDVKC